MLETINIKSTEVINQKNRQAQHKNRDQHNTLRGQHKHITERSTAHRLMIKGQMVPKSRTSKNGVMNDLKMRNGAEKKKYNEQKVSKKSKKKKKKETTTTRC